MTYQSLRVPQGTTADHDDTARAAQKTAPQSNQPPKCVWRGFEMSCGTYRQRLSVDGVETAYFIDSARGILAHKTCGDEHGLFGSGMGALITRAKTPYRIAAILGSHQKIAILKHRAEQMALAEATP